MPRYLRHAIYAIYVNASTLDQVSSIFCLSHCDCLVTHPSDSSPLHLFSLFLTWRSEWSSSRVGEIMSLLGFTSSHRKKPNSFQDPRASVLLFLPLSRCLLFSLLLTLLSNTWLSPCFSNTSGTLVLRVFWLCSSLCPSGLFPGHAWLTMSSLPGLGSFAPFSVKLSLGHIMWFPLSFFVLSSCVVTFQ